jgi:Kelch motif
MLPPGGLIGNRSPHTRFRAPRVPSGVLVVAGLVLAAGVMMGVLATSASLPPTSRSDIPTSPQSALTPASGPSSIVGIPEWYPLDLPFSPPARNGAVIGSTTTVGYPIIFGGQAGPGGTVYNDTDSFTFGAWHVGKAVPAPSARFNASMAYNSLNKTDVLFGGNASGVLQNDTWLFDDGNWSQLHPTGPTPAARSNAYFSFDPYVDEYVLFGGKGAGNVPLNDTWTLNGTNWNEVSTTVAPSPRSAGGFAYDMRFGKFLLFGGIGPGNALLGDTWGYVNGTWNRISLTTPASPSPRAGFGYGYDLANSSIVLFGGENSTGLLNDTWVFHHTAWSQITFPANVTEPTPRYGSAFTYNEASRCMFLFGGYNGTAPLNDTWLYCLPLHVMNTTVYPAHVDVNQPTLLNVSITGGRAPYNLTWHGLPAGPGCAWTGNPTTTSTVVFRCVPGQAGTFTINATITDQLDRNVTSASTSLLVTADPVATTPTATPSAIYVGESVNFSTTVSGGSGALTVGWQGLPSPCVSANVTTLKCAPSSLGTYKLNVTATDQLHYTAVSSSLMFIVYANPASGAPTATPPEIDLGQSVTFATVGAGGPSGYTFVWNGLPSGCPSVNNSTISCTPTAAGTTTITVTVTNSSHATATTPALNFTVLSDPTVSTPTANQRAADVGQTVMFSTHASGGSGVYSYTWSGVPNGCSSTNSSSLSCGPSAAGNYSVSVNLTDSLAYKVSSGALQFTVYSALSVQIVVQPSNVTPGTAVSVTAVVTGGGGTIQYSWTLNNSTYSASGASFSFSPSVTGTYTFAVTTRDAQNATATNQASVTVTAPASTPPGIGSWLAHWWWAIALGVVLAAVVLAAALIVRSRRRRAGPTSSPPDDGPTSEPAPSSSARPPPES